MRPTHILLLFPALLAGQAAAADLFSFGGDLRLRDEYSDAATTLDASLPRAEQNVVRFRARAWAGLDIPGVPLSLNAGIAAEPRCHTEPAATGTFPGKTGVEWRYAILDRLNLRWKPAADVSLTLGRQTLDGANTWLIGDGTPGDGSFTLFFDALRARWKSGSGGLSADLTLLRQNPDADAPLPAIGRVENVNGARYSLTEQRESGLILNLASDALAGARVEATYLWKHDRFDALRPNGDDGDLHTLHAKASGETAAGFSWSVEAAWQFGRKTDSYAGGVRERRDVSAHALNARLTHASNDARRNRLSLVIEHLSGDDGKGRDNLFDVLWGRWPRFSEMAVYTFVNETNRRSGQYNNLQRAGLEWAFNPAAETSLLLAYNLWLAPEKRPTRAATPGVFSGNGHVRGHFVRAVLTRQFTKQISGHLLGEALFQGDYYARRDTVVFARAQVAWEW
ncbi:MAG: alginate export family protein [Opitutaceae bacterium]|jgi:hypothetical protein|nr:alginate export family protein [Opitutaceae bacterium]